jgi:hypothetical protein
MASLLAEALRYRPRYQTDVGLLITDALLVPLGHTEIGYLGSQPWGPSFHRFRQTEAFERIIRDAGVLAYWRAHRFPPQCRPVGAEDFTCD